MDLIKVKNILQSARIIVENQKVEEKIKGEKFNLFSILRMETKENETHSAFLGELLNPFGSHLMGNVFLNLFLDEIENTTLDRNTTNVILEKYIGRVQINKEQPSKSIGGRIDIYLEDNKGNVVSIENKINAPEQELQVVRYFNHKKEKNTVYYLTLTGKTPSDYSKDKLRAGVDFKEIKYNHHILEWLKKCQKESFENTVLRESIKQYIHLLKNLTGKMDDRHKDELYNIILSNYEAAESITLNSNEARKTICEKIKKDVFDKLKIEMKDFSNLEVELGDDVGHKYSQIWIKPKGQENRKLNFIVDSFSGDGHFNGDMYLGILNPPSHDSKYALPPNKLSVNKWIINRKMFSEFKGHKTNLRDKKTIQKLYIDEQFKTEFINHIVKETREYIDDEYPNLESFLNLNKL